MTSDAPDSDSDDDLMPRVYEELRQLAHRQRLGWRGDFTLDTTALVHEAWLKLGRSEDGSALAGRAAANRAHFLGVAARAMRHILCDYARDRRRLKRGGDSTRVPLDVLEELDGFLAMPDDRLDTLAALDEALETLNKTEPRWARVVECRFFAGLSVEETAEVIDASPATVKRDWTMARAWLYRALQDPE